MLRETWVLVNILKMTDILGSKRRSGGGYVDLIRSLTNFTLRLVLLSVYDKRNEIGRKCRARGEMM